MCKTICLVKKDPTLPEAPDNWLIMNGFEFYIFAHSEEGKKRKNDFVKMPPFDYDDPDDIMYIIEYGKHKKKAVKKSANHAHYLKRQEFDYPLEIISYSHFNEDGLEDDYEALMTDPDCYVEEDALDRLLWSEVLMAISRLNELDQEVIREYYLGEKPLTLREYAARHNIPKSSACTRRLTAIRHLKKIIETCYLYVDHQEKAGDIASNPNQDERRLLA